jgi:hypothetical protein
MEQRSDGALQKKKRYKIGDKYEKPNWKYFQRFLATMICAHNVPSRITWPEYALFYNYNYFLFLFFFFFSFCCEWVCGL